MTEDTHCEYFVNLLLQWHESLNMNLTTFLIISLEQIHKRRINKLMDLKQFQ